METLPPPPRELRGKVRQDLGLAAPDTTPYRWQLAILIVSLAGGVLALAKAWLAASTTVAVGLCVVPLWREIERRDARRRERVFTHGREALGQVVAVEPGTAAGGDRLVRVEFWSDGARYETSVAGCRLARRGLAPGEDVIVVFEPESPQRCLIVDRAKGGPIDAIE